ncbi:MAG TPA: glucose PTS transporter subunit IIA [Candidatus Anaerobutyricum stercoris]|uniref:Glucose PTS transporter subunit IIA n=1 Tax=Candidatus Anaerobutyricum stercoris TaxID=2838457 RepID=A0A9D2EM83_9FIRM|nr:glucose PTS transporter subunit IIA [Candidatus Anaerobutyricum stercoris]
MKYEATVKGIVENIGGIDNLAFATHCATRLRFKLKDMSKLKEDALKKVKAVMGVRVMEGNEIQIIIGTDVITVYDEFIEITGYKGAEDGSNVPAGKRKLTLKGVGSMIVEYLSGTVAPVIPIYLGCGMLMAFLTICTNFLGLDAESGTVKILNAASNAGFYFMPIVLGWSAASKLKADPALGALLGMTLVYSDINNVAGLEFLGISVPQIQYNGSFLPMILGAAFLALVYRFFKNKIPQACRYFLLPLVTLVISIPVTLIVLGPIGYFCGTQLMAFLNMLAGQFKLGALAVWGFCTPLSIITGMDKAVYFINMEHLNAVGYDNIFLPGGLAGNAAIGGAALAVWFLSKNIDTKSVGASSGITAIIGITEPALYGICLNFRTPLLGAMTGAAIGSIFAGIVDLKQYVYAGPGLVTSPVYISPDGSMTNFYFCLATIAVSAAAGFAMTYLFSMRNRKQYDGAAEDITAASPSKEVILPAEKEFVAVADGRSMALEDVKDGVFSEKVMGDGVAFLPENGQIVAPCSGKLTAVYDTGHAYGIQRTDGVEVLIHIGLETVSLNGKGFQARVIQGQEIRQGELLCVIDLDYLKSTGVRLDTMMIFPGFDSKKLKLSPYGAVTRGETVVASI